MTQMIRRFRCGRYGVQIPKRSNLPHVANDLPPLQPWCVGLSATRGVGVPLTRDTREDIKRV